MKVNGDYKNSIGELRVELDEIDYQIIKLLISRFSITKQIGKIKQDLAIEVIDQNREDEIIARIRNVINEEDEDDTCVTNVNSITKIYKEIMSESRKQQKNL